MRKNFRKDERGAALLETAITIPIILLICVGIFEFGRAYQTWQVLTNAAREGARVSILTDKTDDQVKAAVENYMKTGGLPCVGGSVPATCRGAAVVNINRNVTIDGNSGSSISVDYPFDFIVLNPVVKMVTPTSKTGTPITMHSIALMRNEG